MVQIAERFSNQATNEKSNNHAQRFVLTGRNDNCKKGVLKGFERVTN